MYVCLSDGWSQYHGPLEGNASLLLTVYVLQSSVVFIDYESTFNCQNSGNETGLCYETRLHMLYDKSHVASVCLILILINEATFLGTVCFKEI